VTDRKIRWTLCGLVAMPSHYDEDAVTADDLASDPDLCTAWTEIQKVMPKDDDPDPTWCKALDAAGDNDLDGLCRFLEKARMAAIIRRGEALVERLVSGRRDLDGLPGFACEDAALAMLPAAGRRAA
jgi:hypothetical protein